MAACAATEEPVRLSELLESGWRLLEEVESGAEPSSGAPAVQRKVQRGVALLERAACAVAELQLFSRNEELEEIASADLKFMLVPALLAALILKQVNPDKRLEHVERARACFMNFLQICKDYGIGQFELPREPSSREESESAGSSWDAAPASDQATLIAMASNRQAKIERYKQKKEVENQLASLKTFIDRGQAEEEQIREFYLLQIKKWISTGLEEIESIDQEVAILSRRDALKKGSATRPPGRCRPPLKPFILTRDAAQAKVFGAGYPSLATMTVDDWYEQHRKQGALPDQGIPQAASGTEERQKEEEGTKEEEEEEDEAVWKAREWDEWKDLHPRGYGNRKNMG
ncbi:immunoglobulin-binding protein 1 [Rhineura floridana]|uniref:immunoglobulin-binding protein 1 n=1 Tax=Rhineura floridana TaxID=261503 RepID=UPI002AC814BB|nr:immunoglobulin-binding protein 1 [Rhineura floridana]